MPRSKRQRAAVLLEKTPQAGGWQKRNSFVAQMEKGIPPKVAMTR